VRADGSAIYYELYGATKSTGLSEKKPLLIWL